MNKDTNKPRFWTRLHDWVHKHHKLTLIIAGVGLILTASLIAMALLYQQPEKISFTPPPPKPKPTYYGRLTGEKVKTEAAETSPVTAIMIENSPDARPQSGLKDAGIVYEAIAEGGITRFLTLHQHDKPKLIGPVRSLRMYYVDWLAPYQASVAHVGGSAAALKEVRQKSYRDIDQFFNAGSYWRASDRYAPHNVYTNSTKLDALNRAKGYKKSDFTGFARMNGKPAAKLTAKNVTINFSSALYNTSYAYKKSCNCYIRSLGGAVHKDRERGQITPKVVVALRVDMHQVFEDGYRESIKTTGKGKATIFQNGTAKNVTWSKSSRKSPLKLLDKSGKEVELVRGQTWIAAVPNGQGSVSWR